MSKKNIAVIGGSSGYGKGIVKALISTKDYFVYVLSRSKPVLEKNEWSFCHHVPFDVKKEEDWYSLANELPSTIYGVIYSAGIAIGKNTIVNGMSRDWKNVFAVNTIGLLRALKFFTPYLMETQGHALHIGSIATDYSYPGAADYCASKAAATTIMKTYRKEVLGTGIRSTSLEIGLGDTNFQLNRYQGDIEKAQKHYAGITQLCPNKVGEFVLSVLHLDFYSNLDTVYLKPIGQAEHGVMNEPIKNN